jgi:hypothetical protein
LIVSGGKLPRPIQDIKDGVIDNSHKGVLNEKQNYVSHLLTVVKVSRFVSHLTPSLPQMTDTVVLAVGLMSQLADSKTFHSHDGEGEKGGDEENNEDGPPVPDDVVVDKEQVVRVVVASFQIVFKPVRRQRQRSGVAEELEVGAPRKTVEETVGVEGRPVRREV